MKTNYEKNPTRNEITLMNQITLIFTVLHTYIHVYLKKNINIGSVITVFVILYLTE